MSDETEHAPAGFLSWVAALVHAHRSQLLAFARSRGLTAEDALDAVQDCFVAFMRIPQSRTIATDSTDAIKLLMVILKHDTLNRRRSIDRKNRAHSALEAREASDDRGSSEALIESAEELARVQGCILRMAKLQRSVVMLSLLDEQPHDAIATTLSISDGYVRVLLHRAREHIRNCSYVYDATEEEA